MPIVLTEFGEGLRQRLFPAVKNRDLVNVALIHFFYFLNEDSSEALTIKKRLREKGLFYKCSNIAFEITEKEVVELLHCSKRKTKQYLDLLRFLSTYHVITTIQQISQI